MLIISILVLLALLRWIGKCRAFGASRRPGKWAGRTCYLQVRIGGQNLPIIGNLWEPLGTIGNPKFHTTFPRQKTCRSRGEINVYEAEWRVISKDEHRMVPLAPRHMNGERVAESSTTYVYNLIIGHWSLLVKESHLLEIPNSPSLQKPLGMYPQSIGMKPAERAILSIFSGNYITH